ncbi:unnamed protein product [Arabidopsis thaliana]|uniref:Uncharacterized protein n=1 Tax=Arabidopsis thaliana TaxID=3702 RepID=A0A5S9X666_ARATH|nr:unnamed protein product [Arabidopsis thaliana]
MCGRDLHGMTLFELMLFEGRLLDTLTNVKAQMLEPRMDEIARQLEHESMSLSTEKETCGKVDHQQIFLRF